MIRLITFILALALCGCAHDLNNRKFVQVTDVRSELPRHMSLAHEIEVPKEWRGGTRFPAFPDDSDIARYVSAYERGWWWRVGKSARNITFQHECSDLFISGWPAATYGWPQGVQDADARIRDLISDFGEPMVSEFLSQFLVPDE